MGKEDSLTYYTARGGGSSVRLLPFRVPSCIKDFFVFMENFFVEVIPGNRNLAAIIDHHTHDMIFSTVFAVRVCVIVVVRTSATFMPSHQSTITGLNNRSGCIINRYPYIKHIARKDNTQIMMNICLDSEHADKYDFVPRTFNIPGDEYEFDQYKNANKKATFIAKPQGGCMGDGIAIFKNLKDVPAHTSRNGMIV